MFGRANDDSGLQQVNSNAVPDAGNPGPDTTESRAAPRGAAPQKPTPEQGEYTVISSGLKIVGTIEGDGDIVVDGTIEGNIKGRMLTIGKGAAINGEIDGETAHVRGAVSGKLSARTVMLAGTARVKGDITYENLSVELGAMWEGRSQRRKAQAAPKQVEVPAATKPEAKPAAKTEVKSDDKGAPNPKSNGTEKADVKTMKDISAAA